jgi:hypothetical protein
MIRDLTILCDQSVRLETAILNNENTLSGYLSGLQVGARSNRKGKVGDVVLFRLKTPGAYADMETLWGKRIPLEVGGEYIGVLCERGSTKLLAAEFQSEKTYLEKGVELQLIAQAGGIGFATGFSPVLEKEYGCGVASDVEVVGVLYDERKESFINTIDAFGFCYDVHVLENIPPSILILGTATDVGKTTVVEAMLKEFSRKLSCAAIKASGSGWFEDSLLHIQSGACPVVNFTFAGLPTTYYFAEEHYVNVMRQLFFWAANPAKIPEGLSHPEMRGRVVPEPDILLVEHGGDLIWANVPAFLKDKQLMFNTTAIIICSESAVALIGALEELRSLGIENSDSTKIFASMPLVNPEGFYRRVKRLLDVGRIEGVFDVNKPLLKEGKEKRCKYSISYDEIFSCSELVEEIEESLARLRSRD